MGVGVGLSRRTFLDFHLSTRHAHVMPGIYRYKRDAAGGATVLVTGVGDCAIEVLKLTNVTRTVEEQAARLCAHLNKTEFRWYPEADVAGEGSPNEGHEEIWKFPVNLHELAGGGCGIRMPVGAAVVSVQEQGGMICIWARVHPNRDTVARRFLVRGTGRPLAGAEAGQYLGTVQLQPYVWHVFESELSPQERP